MGAAFIVSYLASDLVGLFAGFAAQMLVSTVVWYAVFYKARAWLLELRDG